MVPRRFCVRLEGERKKITHTTGSPPNLIPSLHALTHATHSHVLPSALLFYLCSSIHKSVVSPMGASFVFPLAFFSWLFVVVERRVFVLLLVRDGPGSVRTSIFPLCVQESDVYERPFAGYLMGCLVDCVAVA